MTLAVTCCFPWLRAPEIARSLPSAVEVVSGVVLATDSRFSYDDGHRVDAGRKVYVIEPHVAVVFAGDVTAAQRALSDLQSFIERRGYGSRIEMAQVTQQFLQQAYDKARARKRRIGRKSLQPLRMLFGIYDHRSRRPHVLAYSSDCNFVPRTGSGVHAVGAEIDVHNFFRALADRDGDRGTVPNTGLDFQFDVIIAMTSALKSPSRTSGIGGLIQTVLVNEEGVSETSFSHTSGDPTNPSSWAPRPHISRMWSKIVPQTPGATSHERISKALRAGAMRQTRRKCLLCNAH